MRIALVGNQNCGKTTLFNLLTGMNQKIGNWPGVTLEQKSGIVKGTDFELIDLPGIYSLSPYTLEEKVSRDFLLNDKPDLIINVVDATSIRRGLYLTTMLMELDTNVIVVLNMADRLLSKGMKIDLEKFKNVFCANTCFVSAIKNQGIDELVAMIKSVRLRNVSKKQIFSSDVETVISEHKARFGSQRNSRFLAIENISNMNILSLENKYGLETYELIITQRYQYIDQVCDLCVTNTKKRINVTSILDKIFLNKFLAFPIFVLIMFFVYFLSVGFVGNKASDLINDFFDFSKIVIENFLSQIEVSDWIISMVCDGIITGVGSVVSFLPELAVLFLCISFLESTGYMARISFLLDKTFRKIGLSGKALIPFILGTGCSVPGIMSSKILENEYDRKVTAVLTPFIPCSAKLPMIVIFTSYFFRDNHAIVATSFYILSIIIIIVSSLIMKKLFRKSKDSSYISELPEYKLPSLKYVLKDVLDKVKDFLRKAGTVIFMASLIVWFLLSFSMQIKYCTNIEESIMAFWGKKISWIFYPILKINSWEATVSAIQGIIAKEQVISSMQIISGLMGDAKNLSEIFSPGSPFEFFSSKTSYAFVAFNLFSAPCFAAIAIMRKELKNGLLTFIAVGMQILLAYVLAVLIASLG